MNDKIVFFNGKNGHTFGIILDEGGDSIEVLQIPYDEKYIILKKEATESTWFKYLEFRINEEQKRINHALDERLSNEILLTKLDILQEEVRKLKQKKWYQFWR